MHDACMYGRGELGYPYANELHANSILSYGSRYSHVEVLNFCRLSSECQLPIEVGLGSDHCPRQLPGQARSWAGRGLDMSVRLRQSPS